MKDAAPYEYANILNCIDSCTKTFPIYKQCVTKCQIIPGKYYPSKCFNIKSCHVAVKSQQLGLVGSMKNCADPCCKSLHPSQGFNLVEYADKCCSELKLLKKNAPPEPPPIEDLLKSLKEEDEEQKKPPEEKKEKPPVAKKQEKPKTVAKGVATENLKYCDKSVTCDLINPQSSQIPSQVPEKPQNLHSSQEKHQGAQHAQSKDASRRNCKPCIKSKTSCHGVQSGQSCMERRSTYRDIVLCKKCQEKRKKQQKEELKKCKSKSRSKCRCKSKSGSVIYYKRNCTCAKEKGQCTDENCEKLECNKYKCKYLELMQRIKCIFGKQN